MTKSNSAGEAFQRGFSLISAIFLLVVIAALGAFAVTLSTTQHQSAALDVMGSRAYHAARTGVEWAAFQVISSPFNAPAPATCATNFAAGTLGGALAPFTVNVTCGAVSHPEGTDALGATNYVWVYEVSASAVTGGNPGDSSYVERVISVTLAK
ncbi:MAG: hypothetical protein A2063_08630 [Gallionellales bacterium GWA2_60_142]|nr:MAG: hypothetical protein A2063_08630 [Gallionellales bacterium GWA2_60_142]HCI12631.1 agglutinin biogenesis protein MshP [Gallionellaceae bacterium]